MTRIATAQQSKAFENVREALNKQISANKDLIKNLQQYEQQLQRRLTDMQVSGAKTTTIVESDFQLNNEGKVVRVADEMPDGSTKKPAVLGVIACLSASISP